MDPDWWLFFLLANLCLCSSKPTDADPVDITETVLTKSEGSCFTINCTYKNTGEKVLLLWFKDPVYNKDMFEGTIVYSNTERWLQTSNRGYSRRVQYLGNANQPEASCTLRINDLEKKDSGNYNFRIIGGEIKKYMSKAHVKLTVIDNPCKVHVEQVDKEMAKEGDSVILQCSISAHCSHDLEWYEVISEREPKSMSTKTNPVQEGEDRKITELNLSVTWEDHGRMFSCRPAGSTDDCQAKNIILEVKYKPRDTTAQKSSETVKEGDVLTLSCSSKAHPNPSFTWLKNNYTIPNARSSEYTKYNVSPADSGNYYCEAENGLGPEVSPPVSINVLYAPKGVQIKAEPNDVKLGDTLNLRCSEQSSNPATNTYSWYKDDILLNKLGSSLIITKLQQSNSGWYHCQAENDIGSTPSEKIHISVKYAPINTWITGFNQIKLRSTLDLNCANNANPPSNNYSWYFKPEGTQQYILHSQMTQMTYQIKEVLIEDSGSYICNPKNVIGTGLNSTEFEVKVLYPPSQPNLTMVQTIREDEMLFISCSVRSFPAAEMTLSRTSFENPQDTLINKDQTNTIFFSGVVSVSHAGQYNCTAKNSEGQTQATRELKVLYVPKDVQILDHSGQTLKEGNSLTLICEAHSEPPVFTYIWDKSSEEENQRESETVGLNQNLNIHNLTSADSGHYFCTAENELGTSRSASVEIRVKYRPRITIIHNLTSLNDWDGNAPVLLTCSADCYPPVLDYKWFMSEEDTILSHDRTYIVHPQKQGTYYCTVNNEIGKTTSNPIKLFINGLFQKILFWITISLFFLCILIVAIFLVHRIVLRKGSSDGADRQSFFFPVIRARGSQNNTRENLVMAGEMEPYLHRHNQPASTAHGDTSASRENRAGRPVSNIHTVYDAVRPQAIQEDSDMSTVNYASLQIKDHNIPRQSSSEGGTVYAVVSKNKQSTKVVPKGDGDYENVSGAHIPKPDSKINWNSDSSEEEEELNYSKVTFTATQQHKPRHTGDDSSSEEERTQYSQVKIT